MLDKSDYFDFANKMKDDAIELTPNDLLSERNYIAEKVKGNIILASKALMDKDFEYKFNDEQLIFVCQVIAEWTFHKTVDLLRANIPLDCHEAILQRICYFIYEDLMEDLYKNHSQEFILERIEYDVKAEYEKIIKEYFSNGSISEEVKISALSQSSLDKMADDKNNNSNFYTYQKSDAQYLKDKVLVSYAGNLVYKYMLKAAQVLKRSNCKSQDRRIVVAALRNALQALISKIEEFDEFELNVMQIERLFTVAAEIIFHRVVVLHKLNMLGMTETEYALDYFAILIFDLEIVYIKDNDKLKDTFIYTRIFANNNFKKYFKDYVDDGTITKEQYNGLLGKSYIEYLMPEIKKLMYPKKNDKLKEIIFWSVWSVLMLLYFGYKFFKYTH